VQGGQVVQSAADRYTQPHTTDSTTSHEPARKQYTVYKWIPGEQLDDYNTSAQKWREHTSSAQFKAEFENIAN
jgi:hypothetical protein